MTQALVVDDSSGDPQSCAAHLRGHAIRDHRGRGRPKALTACAFLMPDIILLDWNMPVMDGFAFLRELRKMPGGRKPNVLFCTTENDVAHIARAMHAGADDYIMKPFDRDIMKAKIEEIGLAV